MNLKYISLLQYFTEGANELSYLIDDAIPAKEMILDALHTIIANINSEWQEINE